MDEITNKIKSAINVFLNSDDFVVKPLIETETEIGFIIVSDLEKINQLTTMKNKINHRVFIELLTKAMNELRPKCLCSLRSCTIVSKEKSDY
jgi:hypothetical protein